MPADGFRPRPTSNVKRKQPLRRNLKRLYQRGAFASGIVHTRIDGVINEFGYKGTLLIITIPRPITVAIKPQKIVFSDI